MTPKISPPRPTPLRFPEVSGGVRLTAFVNFLQQQQGTVLFDVGGTRMACQICDWQDQFVTFLVPAFGVSTPTPASVRVVLPNGRIAKTIRVMLVPSPTLVTHVETLGQPGWDGTSDGRPVYLH